MDCIPFNEPGQDPTVHCDANVTGCRFVSVKTGVNEADGTQGGTVGGGAGFARVAHTGAGLRAFGVAARDKLAGEKVMAYRRGVLPVEVGAAIAHGQGVESDATGRAIPLAAGVRLGTCMADTGAAGTFGKIALELGA